MSNTQKKNVPELRFPGFEGEWEEKQFADFTKINQGLQIAINERKTEYSPELYFYITNEFLRPNSQTKYFIENPPQSVIANKEDILMTRTGNTGKVVTNVFGAFHNNFFKIKFDKNLYDRLFLVEVLNSSKIQNKILSLAGSSTIPDLNHSDFYSISSSYPLLREQQKIGKFFSKLDRQIELEEQKLELLKQQKKGYMQKIFSQELRFKDENGNDYPDWEEKQLGELSQIVRGASPRPIKDPKWFNKESDIGWLRISDVTNQNGKIYHLEQKLSIEGQEKTRVLVTTHLLLSIAASIGKPVMNFVKTGVHDGFLIFLNPKFNLFFMYYWLEYFKDKWSKYGQPGSQVNLNTEIVKSQTLNMPSNHEQEKVGQFFNRNEKLIELQQEKIMYFKRRKQVLLQKMFI